MKNGPIFAVVAVAIVVLAFVVLSKSGIPKPDLAGNAESAALTTTVFAAHQTAWPDNIIATGPIVPWQEAIIGSEITGARLVEVKADVGDEVKKGQLLAKFNPEIFLVQQAELQASWVQAAAERQRALKLKAVGGQSIQQIEAAESQAAVARARLDEINLKLRYTDVVAPDDGVISSRTATVGAIGAAGQELFRLIRQNRIEWRGELTPTQISAVKQGYHVTITLPDKSKAEAIVRTISPSLDPLSRMAIVYAAINSGSMARAGMYGEGTILLAERQALAVPAKSVVIRDGYNYVFKIAGQGPQSKVSQQKVTVGRTRGKLTEITDGLNAGDIVAVLGAGFLNDGDTVRVVQEGHE